MPSSRLARTFDFCGLRTKLSHALHDFIRDARSPRAFLFTQTTSFTKLAKPTQNALVTKSNFSVFAYECTLNARNRRTLRLFQHTKALLLHCCHLVQCRYRPAI
ncbi:hypothetical protein AVEN_36017-1 [Araneus ventricosus]|uniref:Uncharacterized protein n=1 Tax=Araneus ventricosus TaxID=182803 RepID=A0A4Y2KH04_ARAVE|nr:hypothetical protein AVEN_36017-1 [Araneus ventricosus]